MSYLRASKVQLTYDPAERDAAEWFITHSHENAVYDKRGHGTSHSSLGPSEHYFEARRFQSHIEILASEFEDESGVLGDHLQGVSENNGPIS